MHSRQQRLNLDTKNNFEDIWEYFPQLTRKEIVELYARFIALAAKEKDKVSNADKGVSK